MYHDVLTPSPTHAVHSAFFIFYFYFLVSEFLLCLPNSKSVSLLNTRKETLCALILNISGNYYLIFHFDLQVLFILYLNYISMFVKYYLFHCVRDRTVT